MINGNTGMVLRRIKDDDLPHLFTWRNDPKVWKWCRQNSPLHWAGHLSWFKKQATDSRISMFAIEMADVLVGACGLTDIDLINRRAEFSLYINPTQHRKGFGQMALTILFNHGFKDLGLETIWGETFQGNPAYELFTKKLGMAHEGTRRNFYYRDGKFTDCYLISINKKGFDPRANTPDLSKLDAEEKAEYLAGECPY